MPVVDAEKITLDAKEDAPSPRERLDRALRQPMNAARADKRGKFPMAALRFPADGSPAEMTPLAIAMTAEAWTNIQEVCAAAWALLGDGEPSCSSTAADSSGNEMKQNP